MLLRKTATLLMAICLVLLSVGVVAADAAPWIQNDQADYAPSSVVTLTSGGWQPAEPVQLFVNDSAGQTWSLPAAGDPALVVTADDNGAFTYQFTLPDTFVSDYAVTATGSASGLVATTSFTDAIGSISPTSGPEGQSFTLSLVRTGTPVWTTSTRIVFGGVTYTPTFTDSSHISVLIPASAIPEEGNKTVAITSPTASFAGGFNVTEGDAFTISGTPIAAQANVGFSGTVATFTDTYDNVTMTGFSATINWNDGSATNAGTIARTGPGQYTITGSHTWTAPFLSTSVKTATAYPTATLPIANNGTTSFAAAGSLVILTGTGYQTVTYTGKTTGTSASFTGVSGWTGTGMLAVGNPVTQPFSVVSVTVTEASPGSATATGSSSLTVTDGITYGMSAGNFNTTEGAVYTGSSPFFPGSIATSVFPNISLYRLLVSNGTTSAWYTLYTSGPNNYMYPNSTTGSIIFGDEGSVPYTETLYLNNGIVVGSASGTVTVVDAALSYFSAVNTYNANEGASTGNIQVGKFLDSYVGDGDHSADVTATIHWGDGNTSAGTVTYVGANAYTITGSHTYAEEGTYSARYDVLDDGGSHLDGVSTATIVVADPSVLASGVSLTKTFGQPWSSDVVATFTDPAGAEANDGTHYGATVDFGSGANPALITEAAGTFSVHATVPFTNAGSSGATVVISHEASLPQTVTSTFAVDKADQTITFGALLGKTWGNPDFTVSATASSRLTVTFVASGNCTISGTLVHITGVGSCTITASQAGDSNWNAAPNVKQTFDIAKAALTVTADNKSVIIHAPIPTLTNTITGFVNGDTASVVTGTALCSTTYTPTSLVGTYPITCTQNTLAADNYTFTMKPGTLSVTFTFGGFLQPINDTAHATVCGNPCPYSVFKGGSTIPVKFQLFDANGVLVQQSSTPDWVTPVKGSAMSAPVDESAFTDPATPGGDYFWDGGQYHYNWSTKGVATGFYWKIGVRLDDGTSYYVTIGLR